MTADRGGDEDPGAERTAEPAVASPADAACDCDDCRAGELPADGAAAVVATGTILVDERLTSEYQSVQARAEDPVDDLPTEDFPAGGQQPDGYPAEDFPADGYPADGYRADGYRADDQGDEPTTGWPAPGTDDDEELDGALDGFDAIGMAPYPPPRDPFAGADDDDDYLSTGSSVFDPVYPPPVGWTGPADAAPARGGRARRLRRPLLVAAVLLFLAGLVAAIAVPRLGNGPGRAEAAGAAGAVPEDDASLAGPVDGLTEAAFALIDGAASVKVRADDLGGDLYRITTSDNVTGKVERDGENVRLYLPPGRDGGPTEVDIVLNAEVRWTLRLDGGADRTRVDLTGADVEAVDLNGGATRIDLTLPAPQGLVPVRMTGGVNQFQVRLAGATPVRVRVQSGAGQVTVAGSTHRGIAPGQSFTANGWGSADNGIDLLAVAGMATLTVTG